MYVLLYHMGVYSEKFYTPLFTTETIDFYDRDLSHRRFCVSMCIISNIFMVFHPKKTNLYPKPSFLSGKSMKSYNPKKGNLT